jgi:hypothetical protein
MEPKPLARFLIDPHFDAIIDLLHRRRWICWVDGRLKSNFEIVVSPERNGRHECGVQRARKLRRSEGCFRFTSHKVEQRRSP